MVRTPLEIVECFQFFNIRQFKDSVRCSGSVPANVNELAKLGAGFVVLRKRDAQESFEMMAYISGNCRLVSAPISDECPKSRGSVIMFRC